MVGVGYSLCVGKINLHWLFSESTMSTLTPCPNCHALLPLSDGPTHRYIGASAACWAIYTNLNNGGEPPLAPNPYNALLVDAYAAQHYGVPSDQAIQSVAVHLLTLYGVLVRGVSPDKALWLRQRALREQKSSKRGRYHWLTPPSFAGCVTVADIVREPTLTARSHKVKEYVEQVWAIWSKPHLPIIIHWYDAYIIPDVI